MALVFILDPQTYHQTCEYDQYGHYHCAPHNLFYVIFWYTGGIFTSATITAIATGFIAWFTWTLKRSTDRLWKTSDDQIRLARDDFNATHRPWIPITDAKLNFGLVWSKGNAIISISISCKNTGSSPARRVSLAAGIFPFLVNEDIPKEMATLQAGHRSDVARDLIEHTLFPGMPDEVLPRALVISESTLAALKDGFGEPATEMVPVIIGSIEYYFSFGDPVPHYTPFVFHVWMAETVGVAQKPIQLNGRNVSAKEMILVPLINAGDPT